MSNVTHVWVDNDWVPVSEAIARGRQPRSWSLPPEPGPEVTRVRCGCHGFAWRLVYAPPAGAWAPDTNLMAPDSELKSWIGLLILHQPLTDATADTT